MTSHNLNVSELESRLSMTRAKPRSLTASIGYRAIALAKAVFGRERVMRFCLERARLYWRFAFELAGEIHGADFHNHAKALDEEYLLKWVPEGGRVTDIGCGIGRWAEVAAKKAGHVVGVDYDESLIAAAKARVKAPNVEFVVGDVRDYVKSGRFDLALLTHVIEHVDEAEKLLTDLRAVTKTLIVEVPDFAGDSLNWMRLREGLPFYSDADHVREYTDAILTAQLERNGWKVVELRKQGAAVLAVATCE